MDAKRNNTVVHESSLSRLLTAHAKQHDVAILTAWRHGNTSRENKELNRELKAALLRLNYGVTKVDGGWEKDFGERTEEFVSADSLFVVNLPDAEDFERKILQLGEHYDQDAVMVKPVGGPASLVGTSHREDSWPAYTERVVSPKLTVGDYDQEFRTRVRNRPFSFTAMKEALDKGGPYAELDHFFRHSNMGKQAIASVADPVLRNLRES